MEQANYPCDLHTHTKRSDGNDTYQELIDHAAERGMKVIAITDHDIVPLDAVKTATGQSIPLKQYAKSKGLCVIPGIEFSCNTQVEDVHVVGLGCDFRDPLFAEQARDTVESKVESYQELCRRLTDRNMPILWEEVLSLNGSPIEESAVQKKMIFELMAAKGYAPDWSQAKLMVKHEPYFQIKRRKPDPETIIHLIKKSGGVAILAHPYLIEEPVDRHGKEISRREYIEILISAGLDGMEASYPYEKTSYKGNLTSGEIEREVRESYGARLPILSGGSDYHNDAKKGVKNAREIGEKGVAFEYFLQNALLNKFLN